MNDRIVWEAHIEKMDGHIEAESFETRGLAVGWIHEREWDHRNAGGLRSAYVCQVKVSGEEDYEQFDEIPGSRELINL